MIFVNLRVMLFSSPKRTLASASACNSISVDCLVGIPHNINGSGQLFKRPYLEVKVTGLTKVLLKFW